ncbi:MAG: pectate lyase [Prevotella sp.]|nr:pectate lyase [Prevotella sp.]
MKKAKTFITLLSAALSFLPILDAQAQNIPAFPGAEGHARYTTTGGRGGSVYHVTNLNDSGTGSLRDAVSSKNRIVVFDVSGYIDLLSDLTIKDNITIAGQTAPGDGITLRYRTIRPGNNNIIRYIRFRRSQVKDVNDGADATWQRNKNNIILDHCSFSWSIDEIASFYDNKNFTMQWCNITEALANPGHGKGEHSYGGIWGGKDASFHHNFLAHMQNRVPRFNGARYGWTGYDTSLYENPVQSERVDFRNCVMYNWGTGGCYGGPGGGYINMVNNYYKAGPGTVNKRQVTIASVANSTTASGYESCWGYFSRYYIKGNYVTDAGDDAEDYDWKGVTYDNGLSTINGEKYIPDAKHLYGSKVEYVKNSSGVDCVKMKLDEPIAAGDVTTHSAETAYEKVVEYCGASLVRDACDIRYAEEARTGTCVYTGTVTGRKGIIDFIQNPSAADNPKLVHFPELKKETRPAGYDTDKDGIPDEWEVANGLNKNNAADGKTKTLDKKGWYTNLEVYLNSIVEHITKAQNADAINAVEEYYPEYKDPATSIRPTLSSQKAVIEYFSLDGKRLVEPADGVSIRRITYADGSQEVVKVIKK